MVGQGECAGFTFFGGCCGELLRGGTRGRPRAASRRSRHGCTTNARQTDSLFSLSLSLSLSLARGRALFFFLNFKYLNNKQTNNSRFLLSGVRDVTLPSPGARKWKFPWQKSSNISQSRVLVALQSARKEIFDDKKTRRWRGFLRLGGRPWPAAERGFRLHTRGPAAGLQPSPPRRAASRLGAPPLTFEEAKPRNTPSVPTGRSCSFWHNASWSRRSRGW